MKRPGRADRAPAGVAASGGGDKPASTHRSLERGLAALEWIASAQRPVGLADTARSLGLHRSTAHHLMQALVRAGYVRQEDSTRGYELTQKLYQLTGRGWRPEQIGDMADPVLQELTRATGEGSSVAVWQDGKVRIVAKREADGPVRVVQDVLAERPLYCTAVGKVLAAWLPRAELLGALAAIRMERHTPKTITTREAFDVELRRIRNAGYAIDDEEQHEGLRCIAMPVFTYNGRIAASICVVGPKQRMTHQRLLAVRAPLTAAGRKLSERLGFATTPA
jgi:DNA-binding IclR family transcriptional regulator